MWRIVLLLILLALAGLDPLAAHATTGDEDPGTLWVALLERIADLDGEGAEELAWRLTTRHSDFVPAHFLVIRGEVYVGPAHREHMREELRSKDDPVNRCLHAVYSASRVYLQEAVEPLLEIERRAGPNACTTVFLAWLGQLMTPQREWLARTAEHLRSATHLAPELPQLWHWRADALERVGRPGDAVEVLEEGIVAVPAAQRGRLYARLADALRATADSASASALLRALDQAVARDGRPGIRWLRPLVGAHRLEDGGEEAILGAQLEIALSGGSSSHVIEARHRLAWHLGNAGNTAQAIEHFDGLVVLGDALNDSGVRIVGLLGRGRMLSNQGRLEEAERDLLRLAELARESGDVLHLAEAYHNLGHVYEGMGRIPDALIMGDHFVDATQPLRHTQPRIMSHRDAGELRLRLGWHAAANESFARLVRIVDEQEQNYYWAGEHFERVGRLEHALDYYRRGLETDLFERTLNLAGLVRVYRHLGRADSAEAAARRHDAAIPDQLTVPLLPGFLAQQGRPNEAVAAARDWVRRRERDGNLRSLVLARIGLAEFLLEAGRFAEAAAEARGARGVAGRANLDAEQIRAGTVEGAALVRLNRVAGGLARLRLAAAAAERRGTDEDLHRVHLALGHALARMGREEGALAAYDAAARVVERIGNSLTDDLNLARFRDRSLDPFDAAIHLLHRTGDVRTGDVAALLAWSQRRKTATLRIDGEHLAPGGAEVQALRSLVDSLGDAVLVDYILTDSLSVAVVVSAQRAVAVPLRTDLRTLEELVERLRRPFVQYGGRLDMARIDYDLGAAHALYQAVVAPIEPLLRDADRILVSPDGPLHRVPFDALVTRQPARTDTYETAHYLLDRYTLILVPALHTGGIERRGRPAAPFRVVVLAGDVPGGEAELESVRAAWGAGQTTVLSGPDASEAALRLLAPRASILHLATHAEANDRDPLASHLRLAAGEGHDGYLHLAEAAQLSAPARLVVLTGCETLAGPLYRGSGLMGLARAFLAGGAEAVVATHWPVGGTASSVAGDFHRRLAAGTDAPTALTEAKRTMRRDLATANPFFWGAFVLIRRGPG